jgi:hypothetical protein
MAMNIRTATCANGSSIIPPGPSILAAPRFPLGNLSASMTALLTLHFFLSKQALSVRLARLLSPNHISVVVQRGVSWLVHELGWRYGLMISEAEACIELCAVYGARH